MLVEDAMTADAVTVTPATTIKHALELLDRHRVTSMPVVEGHRLCGVVSEADLIRDLVAHDPRSQLRPVVAAPDQPTCVADVMSRHPVTVRPDTDLAVAVALLTSATIKSVPVVDDEGHVRGVLSRSDVVRRFARADETIAQEVRAALTSVDLDGWSVDVHDGVVEVRAADGADGADPDGAALARVMASHVPGVVGVRTT